MASAGRLFLSFVRLNQVDMTVRETVSYMRAGYLLHMVSCLEASVCLCIFYFQDKALAHHFAVKTAIISVTIFMVLFAQLDARSRYQNYKLIKDNLFIYGFQERILKPFMKSRCQRDAMMTAAAELGMQRQCNEYFRKLRYRWYHLVPDVILTRPSVLLTKSFWVSTLFERSYKPKNKFSEAASRPLFSHTANF